MTSTEDAYETALSMDDLTDSEWRIVARRNSKGEKGGWTYSIPDYKALHRARDYGRVETAQKRIDDDLVVLAKIAIPKVGRFR